MLVPRETTRAFAPADCFTWKRAEPPDVMTPPGGFHVEPPPGPHGPLLAPASKYGEAERGSTPRSRSGAATWHSFDEANLAARRAERPCAGLRDELADRLGHALGVRVVAHDDPARRHPRPEELQAR